MSSALGKTFALTKRLSSDASHPQPRQDGEPSDDEVVDARALPERPPATPNPRLDVGVGIGTTRYVSPLPSPEDLERYEKLIPGSPDRLLAAGEREQAHRHDLESRLAAIDEAAMPRFYEGQRRGQSLGFAAALAYLLVMLAAILKGEIIGGVVGAGAGAGALVWSLRRESGRPPTEAPSSSGELEVHAEHAEEPSARPDAS